MRKSRLLASLLCAVLMVGVLTVPAYAGGGDESEDGVGEYDWGHYYDDGAAAEKDYADRAADYQRRFKVREVKRPIAQQMREAVEQAGERPTPPRREAPDRGDR